MVSPVEKICLWAGNALSLLTGLLLLWTKTFYRAPPPVDEFDLGGLAHPWQSMAQHLHIWTAPLLVIAIGMLWYAHGVFSLQAGLREGRRTGIVLLALGAPMILSGYAIGTSVSDVARSVWIWIHLGSSAVWLIALLGHTVFRRKPTQVT